jgi:multiple sugar transport system permease protein
VLVSIYLSLTDWRPVSGRPWWRAELVGFDNYVSLATNGEFLYSVGFTLFIVVTAVTLEFLIGFGLALLCQGEFRGKRLFVLALLTPMMIMPVVVGNVFRMMFRPGGPIDQAIGLVVGQPVSTQWMSTFPAAIVPILSGEVWHWYPLLFLILYSGLEAVPETQVRAAETLGASPLQIFRRITLPNLLPVILIGLVIRAMGAIKIFDVVFATTRGGPGASTQVISLYLYEQSFEFFNIGFGSAVAWVIFIASVAVFARMLAPLLYEEELYPDADAEEGAA